MRKLFLVFFIFAAACLEASDVGVALSAAHENYLKGEKASTVAEQEKYFNEALKQYKQVERASSVESGGLYYNIANSYFVLGHYSMAVFYYYKSLRLDPFDLNANHNLRLALIELGLQPPSPSFTVQMISALSAKWKDVLIVLTLALFLSCSWFIWRPCRRAQLCFIGSLATWLLAIAAGGYSHYFTRLEGVIIESTLIHQMSEGQFEPASTQPIQAGSKVEVLDVVEEGQWIKILSPSNQPGYISYKALRII